MTKQRLVTWKSNVLLLIVTTAFLLLVLEGIIRTYDWISGDGFFSGNRNQLAKTEKPIYPFRTFGYQLYQHVEGVRYISSRHGELFPLNKKPGTYRIVVFGGSTTENKRAFNKEGIHYPLVLQSALRSSLDTQDVEVINVGFAAYSTAHSLIVFELDVLSWEPDLIIVSHNINDLLAAYWPDLTFDYSNKYGDTFFLPNNKTKLTLSNLLFQHSQLYWWIKGRINSIESQRDKRLRRESYGAQPPELMLEIFTRNLRSIVAIAKENKIKVLLGNQPIQPSEEYFARHMGFKPYNYLVTYPLHNEFLSHHEKLNNTIKQVSQEFDVSFADNQSVLGDDKRFFIDFVHYTPAGVRLLAGNYAKVILDQSLIQAPKKPRQGDQ